MALIDHSEQWILETLYKANRTDIETYRLYLTLRRYIYDVRDFNGVIEQISPTCMRFKPNTDIADDCFYSVSLFTPYIRRRSKKTGSPGVRFYSRMGRNAFDTIGYSAISKNWKFWVNYVQEYFILE
ncbi:hypothetical protein CL634_10735 [bacterium]|nr:hypothetical protein [bacterium]|tara:strand:+ start:111 stop:491 length:381 start_codon:yes stop_codon:yes gene_type:complete